MPIHPRWVILALLLAVTIVNFVDRQALSVLAPVLRNQFKLSNTDYGFIVACFQLGMMTGEFPMGWLADRKGARFTLSFAVVWWSVATGLHSLGRAMWHFAALRFWLGTGESANFSSGMKVVAHWFPPEERAFAVGIFNAGTMIGAMIAPPALVFLTLRYGWQSGFLVPFALGLVWVVAWRSLYRVQIETVESGPRIANAELLRHPEVWGLILCRLLIGPVVQFYWYWTPEYLFRERGLSLQAIGLFAWIPFLFGDIGNIGGGWLAGWLMRRGTSLTAARRITMYGGAALCLLSFAVPGMSSAAWAIVAICLVLLGHTCLSANFFARISDLAPAAAVSRVTGLTGVAGGLSGMLFPLLTGWLVDRVSYTPVFLLAALMPLAGVVLLETLSRRSTLNA